MNQHYFDVPFAFGGDVTSIPDPLQVGGTVSFTEGWNYNYQRNLSTDPNALPIDRSTMNWLLLQITTALQALQQAGIPEFITSAQNGGTAFAYGKGAVVLWSATGNAPFAKYVNLTAANVNTPSVADPQGLTSGWQIEVDPISTVAQAAAGADDASIMTPLKVAQQTALRALLAGNSSQVFNVGPATALSHAPQTAQVQTGTLNYAGISGGPANALTATLAPAPTAYTAPLEVIVQVGTGNNGPATLNVNGLGAVAVVGPAHTALLGGELIAGGLACFVYDASLAKFILAWATGGNGVLGGRQLYGSVTGSRALNTTYTNTTSAPIWVAVQVASTAAGQSIGFFVSGIGETACSPVAGGSANNLAINSIVPPGGSYVVQTAGGLSTLVSWNEYR